MDGVFEFESRQRWWQFLPFGMVLGVLALFWMHGPIAQLDHYHEFADQAQWGAISHARDVISNLAFLIVGLWALFQFGRHWSHIPDHRRPALLVFILSILATAWCSSFYHLAPDDARLFWDRLPIAIACASLLALMRPIRKAHQNSVRASWRELAFALMFAYFSVWWWQYSADLRPYLVLQIFAIILPPCWQLIQRASKIERLSFVLAITLYVLAKLCELADSAILQGLVVASGHSLKHLLAALAAYFILLPWLQPWRSRLWP